MKQLNRLIPLALLVSAATSGLGFMVQSAAQFLVTDVMVLGILLIALIALLTQWQRQDTTEARRTDRHLDSGTDQSYDAYNEMMARLAAADRAAERSRD